MWSWCHSVQQGPHLRSPSTLRFYLYTVLGPPESLAYSLPPEFSSKLKTSHCSEREDSWRIPFRNTFIMFILMIMITYFFATGQRNVCTKQVISLEGTYSLGLGILMCEGGGQILLL